MTTTNNRLFALFLGVITITIQILFIREFFNIFYGNELCYGILLAGWMFWTAAGSLLGHYLQPLHKRSFHFYFTIIVALVIIDLIVLKFVRYILNVPYGEFISITGLTLFSFVLLALPCFFMGLLYSRLAAQSAALPRISGDPSAFVYGWEAAGSVVASLLLTFILLTRFTPLVLMLMLYLFGTVLLFVIRPGRYPAVAALLALLIILAFKWFPLQSYLQRQYWESLGAEMTPVEQRQSHYGQLSIVRWAGEKVLYNNGIKQTALHEPIDNQALAAIILTQSPSPRDLCLVGGGLGGLATELAKAENLKVDYFERDKIAFDLVQDHLNDSLRQQWQQSDLSVLFADARNHLRSSTKTFDIIAVNVGSPMSALQNRYYTIEFFRLARNRLKPGGVLAICNFPSSADYLGPELLQLNASLYHSLRLVYDYILVCPGVSAHYFASESPLSLTTDLDSLEDRYRALGLSYDYFFPQLFFQYFLPERLQYVVDEISAAPYRINRDFQPISYFFDLVLWYKIIRTRDTLGSLFKVQFSSILWVILGFLLLWVLSSLLYHRNRKVWAAGIFLNTILLGFTSIGLNVILIISFQISFGALYHNVGMAIAAYMAGLALGSLFANRLLWFEGLFLLLLFLLLILICFLKPLLTIFLQYPSVMLYYLLITLVGALLGAFFPLLCHQYTLLRKHRQPGSIYAADLIGASAGALVVSTFLIPLYGISRTILIPGLLTAGGFLFFLLKKIRFRL
ncbi:hypothetical protein GF407_11820 [candidate division KSB1 bacterium]|nr:hypothetical protein [candidate division KSB1 bacterium]